MEADSVGFAAPTFGQVYNDWNYSLLSAQTERRRSIDHESTTVKRMLDQHLNEQALLEDFEEHAVSYVRVVSGEDLVGSGRILETTQLGVAGGRKIRTHSLLLKFASNRRNIYSSSEGAAKVAGNEARYISLLQDKCGDLPFRVPLTACVDFRGHRLLATAFIPDVRADTLVYGSADAGQTVHFQHAGAASVAEQIALRLNLSPRTHVQPDARAPTGWRASPVHGPVDLEVHLAGRPATLWVIDAARIMPPEDVAFYPLDPASHLHRHLRPELVLNLPQPLSPDAYFALDRWLDALPPSARQAVAEEQLAARLRVTEATLTLRRRFAELAALLLKLALRAVESEEADAAQLQTYVTPASTAGPAARAPGGSAALARRMRHLHAQYSNVVASLEASGDGDGDGDGVEDDAPLPRTLRLEDPQTEQAFSVLMHRPPGVPGVAPAVPQWFELTDLAHACGVNVRHMGAVLRALSRKGLLESQGLARRRARQQLRRAVLHELVARTLKAVLCAKLRDLGAASAANAVSAERAPAGPGSGAADHGLPLDPHAYVPSVQLEGAGSALPTPAGSPPGQQRGEPPQQADAQRPRRRDAFVAPTHTSSIQCVRAVLNLALGTSAATAEFWESVLVPALVHKYRHWDPRARAFQPCDPPEPVVRSPCTSSSAAEAGARGSVAATESPGQAGRDGGGRASASRSRTEDDVLDDVSADSGDDDVSDADSEGSHGREELVQERPRPTIPRDRGLSTRGPDSAATRPGRRELCEVREVSRSSPRSQGGSVPEAGAAEAATEDFRAEWDTFLDRFRAPLQEDAKEGPTPLLRSYVQAGVPAEQVLLQAQEYERRRRDADIRLLFASADVAGGDYAALRAQFDARALLFRVRQLFPIALAPTVEAELATSTHGLHRAATSRSSGRSGSSSNPAGTDPYSSVSTAMLARGRASRPG